MGRDELPMLCDIWVRIPCVASVDPVRYVIGLMVGVIAGCAVG